EECLRVTRFPLSLIFSLIGSAVLTLGAAAQEQPQKIVSIGGGVTETLYALGAQDRIVAVDTTSLYPQEALETKPNVGYMRALSAEGVLALSPDLILMDGAAGPPEALELL